MAGAHDHEGPRLAPRGFLLVVHGVHVVPLRLDEGYFFHGGRIVQPQSALIENHFSLSFSLPPSLSLCRSHLSKHVAN